jgi:hypothetical protein
MTKPSLIEAYERINDISKSNRGSIVERIIRFWDPRQVEIYYPFPGEPAPEGVARAGAFYPSVIDDQVYFILTPQLSEKIIKNYKGEGVSALADGQTMTEKGIIQKPRGFLTLKKDIARITHNIERDIIIYVNNRTGVEWADGLLKSVLKS